MFNSDKPLPPPATLDLSPPPPPPISKYADDENNISPCIDGPPSPTRIRAYTEQMRMNPQMPPQGKMYSNRGGVSVHSFASSLRSRSSSGSEIATMSRQPSISNSNKKPHKQRPESVLKFGRGLFSRTKKSKRDFGGSRSSSSLSNHIETIEDTTSNFANDNYYGGRSRNSSRSGTFTDSIDETVKPQISVPFNFQHVTHTRQEQLPCLERTSRNELVSEFSALRASQAPLRGHLKGIQAEDLHFEDFSAQSLDVPLEKSTSKPRTAHQRSRQNTLTSVPSPLSQPEIRNLNSYDDSISPHSSPPQLPSQSSNQDSPIPPPIRTSSRAASMVWDSFDTMHGLALDRPKTSGSHFRKKHSFHLPISEPLPMKHSTDDYFSQPSSQPTSGQRTPEVEQWPLPTPELEGPSLVLADVPEENETAMKRFSNRTSMRHSKSVPFIRNAYQYFDEGRSTSMLLDVESPIAPDSASGVRHEAFDEVAEIGMALSSTRTSVQITSESWEDDIDYCYDHEVEADCDYEWDQCSINEARRSVVLSKRTSMPQTENDRSDRFRGSLLVPSAMDLPTLSPTSSATTPTSAANPATPSEQTCSAHLRSQSQASSFKESHGFTLSPSLLIPSDYAAAMDSMSRSELDDQLSKFNDMHSYNAPLSPASNSRLSSTSSSTYRSSAFSHFSHTSNTTSISSSIAQLPKSLSQESMHLLHRTSAAVTSHRSLNSTSSFPDLIGHFRKPPAHADAEENDDLAAPSPGIPFSPNRRRTTSSARSTKTNPSYVIVHPPSAPMVEGSLSPVQEMVPRAMECERYPAVEKLEAAVQRQKDEGKVHGRKISAPLLSRPYSPPGKVVDGSKTTKGRKRAQSSVSKGKGGYGLFPVS